MRPSPFSANIPCPNLEEKWGDNLVGHDVLKYIRLELPTSKSMP